jgi:hypothetical protein
MSEKRYIEQVGTHPDQGMVGPELLICTKCGRQSARRAIKCEDCGEVFLYNANRRGNYGDQCPRCRCSKVKLHIEEEHRRKHGPPKGAGVVYVDTYVRFVPQVLTGLTAVNVVVEQLGLYGRPAAESRLLQITVERLLVENGVKVLRPKRRYSGSVPVLVITVQIETIARTDLAAVHTSVRLKQEMLLKRDPTLGLGFYTTWERTSLETVQKKDLERHVREAVELAAYDFLDTYHQANQPGHTPKTPQAQMQAGTIRYLDFEGGFYGIVADNGEKYDPVNLPRAYRKDGLRVKFHVKEKKGMAGIHMWGKIVEILSIEKL